MFPYTVVAEEILLCRTQIEIFVRISFWLLLVRSIPSRSELARWYKLCVDEVNGARAFDHVKPHQSIHSHADA